MNPPIIGNPRFFARTGPHPLGVVAMAAGCAVPVQELLLSGLASLELAEPDQISFLGNARQVAALERTHAGAYSCSLTCRTACPPDRSRW